MTARQQAPHVYRAISAITAAFAEEGIPKTHFNLRDQYPYRSIDDVLNRLGPLLAQHRLCVLPRVLKHRTRDCLGEQNTVLASVRLLAAFDLVSARDGSCHTVQCWGEALDAGDKGTPKAMSSAFKGAMLQTFCIPIAGEDTDASSHRVKIPVRVAEPVEGWPAWSEGVIDMIAICERTDALDRVRTRHGKHLTSLKREQPELYAKIGKAFAERGRQLEAPAPKPKGGPKKVKPERLEAVDA